MLKINRDPHFAEKVVDAVEESFSGDEEWWNVWQDGGWTLLSEKDWPP